MRQVEKFFEWLLWESRLVVLVAVLASLAVGLGAFYMATVDAVHVIQGLGPYAGSGLSYDQRVDLRADTLSGIVKTMDGYLVGAIMLIFALGLYELFIKRVADPEGDEGASGILRISTLDELKDRLARLVLLILVIEFFNQALHLKFTRPLDLLYMAAAIGLVAAAVYISSLKMKQH